MFRSPRMKINQVNYKNLTKSKKLRKVHSNKMKTKRVVMMNPKIKIWSKLAWKWTRMRK